MAKKHSATSLTEWDSERKRATRMKRRSNACACDCISMRADIHKVWNQIRNREISRQKAAAKRVWEHCFHIRSSATSSSSSSSSTSSSCVWNVLYLIFVYSGSLSFSLSLALFFSTERSRVSSFHCIAFLLAWLSLASVLP